MHDPDLVPLLDVAWPRLDHRAARARLVRLGWSICGVGDWAYAYRSPGGSLVARVGPFEPAYGYFVDLCRRCAGNRYVPRIDRVARLEGGGHLAVMEYLSPPDQSRADAFLRQWHQPDETDDDLRVLRHEVMALDDWGRHNVRWWGKVDIGSRHVLLSTDTNLKLIDLFFVTWDLLEELVNDPHTFTQHLPADQCRYILDIPDLHDASAEQLTRIRDALAVIGGRHTRSS